MSFSPFATRASATPTTSDAFTLTSPAFAEGGTIPVHFTCEGANVSPPLRWSGAPAGARSLALTLDDPDAPSGDWVHWVIYNLPASAAALPAHIPAATTLPDGTRQCTNSFQRLGYDGPCPPPGKPHRYIFRLYALDAMLRLPPGATKAKLQQVIAGHILAQAETFGTVAR